MTAIAAASKSPDATQMRRVPGGSFRMGSASDCPEERPARRVAKGGSFLWASSYCRRCRPAAKPNILVIMGDDPGIWNIGACHHGLMAGPTPNLDRLAAGGVLFADQAAEPSAGACRAHFG